MNSEKSRLELPSVDSVTTQIGSLEEMEEHLKSGLKHEINALLFKWLPDSSTVRDVEQVSCAIFFEIHQRWEKHVSDDSGAAK
jgi:hypothetical protein